MDSPTILLGGAVILMCSCPAGLSSYFSGSRDCRHLAATATACVLPRVLTCAISRVPSEPELSSAQSCPGQGNDCCFFRVFTHNQPEVSLRLIYSR